MRLSDDISVLKGVGPEVAKKLAENRIYNLADLANYWPRTYEDFSQVKPIHDIVPGMVTIKAAIRQINGRYARRGLHITGAVASDDSSSVRLLGFNQPYREAAIKRDAQYYVSGVFE